MSEEVGVHLVEPDLAAPPERGGTLRHDADFEAWEGAVEGAREVVNRMVGVLGGLGVHLPALPEVGLRTLLVDPLVGDLTAVRATADSCVVTRDALRRVALNLGIIGAWSVPVWEGRAAEAFRAALVVRAVRVEAFAELVGAGWYVLDEIAGVMEHVQVEVEAAVAELGEVLLRVVARILSRVSSPVGWGVFALEFGLKGLDAVTDIVDDLRRVWEIIDALIARQEEVAAWAQTQQERLDAVLSVAAMVRSVRAATG